MPVPVLCALPAAVLATALAAACWQCHTLRRALTRERVVARLDRAAWARDTAALEQQLHALTVTAAAREHRDAYVLADAALIIDTAAARYRGHHP
jgi:hypothetical protein